MKRILGLVLCLISILQPGSLYGLEEEEDRNIESVISFELTAEDRFTYEVRVSKGGSLIDGSQRITDGIMIYELSVGETKQFQMEPSEGYELKEIRIDNKDIGTNIDRITIEGVSKNSLLEVRYEKRDEIEMPEETLEDSKNQKNINIRNQTTASIPQTGDWLRVGNYICLLLIVVYGVYVNRKGIDTYKNVNDIAIWKDIEENIKGGKQE